MISTALICNQPVFRQQRRQLSFSKLPEIARCHVGLRCHVCFWKLHSLLLNKLAQARCHGFTKLLGALSLLSCRKMHTLINFLRNPASMLVNLIASFKDIPLESLCGLDRGPFITITSIHTCLRRRRPPCCPTSHEATEAETKGLLSRIK